MEKDDTLQQALDRLHSPRVSEEDHHTVANVHVPWASLPVEILGNIVRLLGSNPNHARSFSQVCSSWRASVSSEKRMLKELEFKTLRLVTPTNNNDNRKTSHVEKTTKKQGINLPWILELAANASNMAASVLAARFYQLQALEKEAKKHWVRAARMGHPEACWRLGVAYYRGEGALTVQQDSEEALFWLNKAAKALIASSQDLENVNFTSSSNSNSEITPRKLHFTSEQCFLMSDSLCMTALKEASHILGVIHLDGDATKQDTGTAIKWLQMAEMCGCNEAGRMLQSLFRSGQY
jgi:ribosomal protein L24E